mmetsp:Transcript_18129/g.29775  ORF Transcript_18129/g.29775 Transcript_18129/m.29775 type:complete len:795 (+) Transcript_18129:64-2448(+)
MSDEEEDVFLELYDGVESTQKSENISRETNDPQNSDSHNALSSEYLDVLKSEEETDGQDLQQQDAQSRSEEEEEEEDDEDDIEVTLSAPQDLPAVPGMGMGRGYGRPPFFNKYVRDGFQHPPPAATSSSAASSAGQNAANTVSSIGTVGKLPVPAGRGGSMQNGAVGARNPPSTLGPGLTVGNSKAVSELYHEIPANIEDRPWLRPGADITDYFNYGFNEDTWNAYSQKQAEMRRQLTMQSRIKVFESGSSSQPVPVSQQQQTNAMRMSDLPPELQAVAPGANPPKPSPTPVASTPIPASSNTPTPAPAVAAPRNPPPSQNFSAPLRPIQTTGDMHDAGPSSFAPVPPPVPQYNSPLPLPTASSTTQQPGFRRRMRDQDEAVIHIAGSAEEEAAAVPESSEPAPSSLSPVAMPPVKSPPGHPPMPLPSHMDEDEMMMHPVPPHMRGGGFPPGPFPPMMMPPPGMRPPPHFGRGMPPPFPPRGPMGWQDDDRPLTKEEFERKRMELLARKGGTSKGEKFKRSRSRSRSPSHSSKSRTHKHKRRSKSRRRSSSRSRSRSRSASSSRERSSRHRSSSSKHEEPYSGKSSSSRRSKRDVFASGPGPGMNIPMMPEGAVAYGDGMQDSVGGSSVGDEGNHANNPTAVRIRKHSRTIGGDERYSPNSSTSDLALANNRQSMPRAAMAKPPDVMQHSKIKGDKEQAMQSPKGPFSQIKDRQGHWDEGRQVFVDANGMGIVSDSNHRSKPKKSSSHRSFSEKSNMAPPSGFSPAPSSHSSSSSKHRHHRSSKHKHRSPSSDR